MLDAEALLSDQSRNAYKYGGQVRSEQFYGSKNREAHAPCNEAILDGFGGGLAPPKGHRELAKQKFGPFSGLPWALKSPRHGAIIFSDLGKLDG